MNYFFSTSAERIAVIEALRHQDIILPTDWDPNREKQKQSTYAYLLALSNSQRDHCTVIHWLLQHDPARRPTAIQLSQSPLLPPRVEDEYFKAALNVMSECYLESNNSMKF